MKVCYIAASLPAFWILQNALLPEGGILLNAGPAHLTVVDVVIITLLLKIVFNALTTKKFPDLTPMTGAIIIYIGVNLLATIAAGAKFVDGQSKPCLTALARFAADITVVTILACAVTDLSQAKRCIGIVFATLAVLAAIQFISFFGASHEFVIGEVQGVEREQVRYFGPVGDSIGVVLLLGYIVSLCFGNAVGVAGFLGGILLTAGFGAIFSVAIGTTLFLLLGPHSSKTSLLSVLAFVAIGCGAVFGKTLTERLRPDNVVSSAGQRLACAQFAGAMIADNPVFGVGYMGYQGALERYGGDKFFDLNRRDGATANANNQFLQSLTDGGMAGFLAAGWLVFCAARLLLKVATQSEDRFLSTFYLAAFIWLLAQVFGNLAAVWLSPSCYVGRFLWIMLGIGLAIERLLPVADSQPTLHTQPTRNWVKTQVGFVSHG